MRDEISVKITNIADADIIYTTFDYVRDKLPVSGLEDLEEALRQLIENVLTHAYERPYEISLLVHFSISSCELRIDVEDSGIPFDFTRYLSEPIDRSANHTKGFFHIYDLVDRFYFKTLHNQGKRFTLIQMFDRCFDIKTYQVIPENIEKEYVLQNLVVRTFIPGDGDGIAKLIYRNYDYTYYKELFYKPHEVKAANESGDVRSIVALCDDQIIGHFALIYSRFSNIAEIAVATVDPRYKQMGIMNTMFDFLITTAKKLGFKAIYGEAIMLHPYSQKANLRHGMSECAIALGEVPSEMTIEKKLKNVHRSGSLISFLLFDKTPRYLVLPICYAKMLKAVYNNAHVTQIETPLPYEPRDPIEHRINTLLNIGIIRFEALVDEKVLIDALNDLINEHCDMIYADINLHRIKEIDTLVALLNTHQFFYGGVLFAFYNTEDYLRLQRKNSKHIDEEQLVCYSENAKTMLEFIREDEERIKGL